MHTHLRSPVFAAVLASLLTASVLGAIQIARAGPSEFYTGCLEGGTLLDVRRGDTPKEPCTTPNQQVSWNSKTRSEGLIGANAAEVLALQGQIAALQSDLDDETAARMSADAGLQSDLDAEALARVAADAVLQSALDAEALARTAADGALGAQITTAETFLGRVPVANRGVTNLATIGGDGPLAVPYGNVILNSDASVFSVSGGTLTVLKEGHIAAIAVLELSFPTAGASAASIVDWKVNGVSTSSGILNVFNADSAHINDQVIAALSFHLNAGDTIELHASCGSTAPPCPTIWNGHLSVSWFGVP